MTSSLQQQSGKKFFFLTKFRQDSHCLINHCFFRFFFIVPTSYIPISRRLSKNLGTFSKRYLIEVGHVRRRGSQAPLRSIPPLPKTNESLQVNPFYILTTPETRYSKRARQTPSVYYIESFTISRQNVSIKSHEGSWVLFTISRILLYQGLLY